ncbi:MAG: type I glutamate--ammonia ligase [Phycisphaeraceae bacterium]|nr:type I glutamate--ammonia ligase [Phycisphaeraceae bacterium]
MTPKEVIALAKENGAKILDLRFMDFPGMWQHTSYPISMLDEDCFEDGFGFDGSSIRGWQAINESDMLLKPQADTAFMDPFREVPTLALICNIADPITRADYTRDPRNISRKSLAYLRKTGIADQVYIGPEAEFFVFDDVRYESRQNSAFYAVDSDEGAWNTGRTEPGGNSGYKLRYKEGYFPCPPSDTLMDLRTEMVLHMLEAGIDVECHHHEVATGGQCEIDMRFTDMVKMADQLVLYKYIVKNTARKYGKSATFMPKPLFADNGSGMHTHISLWKGDTPLFAGDGYAGLSQTALYAIGGILKHAAAICAFSNPSTNSYKRLVPGYEAPVNLAYSSRNRSAACRIPVYSASPKSKRVEFRCPDPSCNPYLTFSALLMAAIDGIQNKIDPGSPLDVNIYDLDPEEASKVAKTPGSLDEALLALNADHDFLLKGDVFTPDVIETWIEYKMKNEVDAVRLRPHPHEFVLYYDI